MAENIAFIYHEQPDLHVYGDLKTRILNFFKEQANSSLESNSC